MTSRVAAGPMSVRDVMARPSHTNGDRRTPPDSCDGPTWCATADRECDDTIGRDGRTGAGRTAGLDRGWADDGRPGKVMSGVGTDVGGW
jgi:hypothetical protein